MTLPWQTTEISEGEVYDPVIQQVVQMLKSFMVSHSSLFLLPRLWHLCDPILRNYVGPDEPALQECLGRISKRNLRLLTTVPHNQVWRAPDTPRQRVISALDSVSVDSNFPLLASDCLREMEDLDALVAVCLEWGSSLYRNGDENIYICARLLRQYSKGRTGLDMSIMSFLAVKPRLEGLSIAKLFRILTELLRSKHLAPGRYISWIMARGNLREPLMANQVTTSLAFACWTAQLIHLERSLGRSAPTGDAFARRPSARLESEEDFALPRRNLCQR